MEESVEFEIEKLKKEERQLNIEIESEKKRKTKCQQCREMFTDVVRQGSVILCQNCHDKKVEEERIKKENYPLRRSRHLIKKTRNELKEIDGLLGMYEKRQR